MPAPPCGNSLQNMEYFGSWVQGLHRVRSTAEETKHELKISQLQEPRSQPNLTLQYPGAAPVPIGVDGLGSELGSGETCHSGVRSFPEALAPSKPRAGILHPSLCPSEHRENKTVLGTNPSCFSSTGSVRKLPTEGEIREVRAERSPGMIFWEKPKH